MTEPRATIKFVAPYSLNECRHRLRRSNVDEQTGHFYLAGFISHTKSVSDSKKKVEFKIQAVQATSEQRLRWMTEMNGTFLHLSDDETLVSANFRIVPPSAATIRYFAGEVLLLTITFIVLLPVIGNKIKSSSLLFFIIVILLIFFIWFVYLVGSNLTNHLRARFLLRKLLRQELGADSVPLRKAKDS